MKKQLIFIILSGLISGVFAAPVDFETAKSVGQAFWTNKNTLAIRSLKIPDLTLVYTADKPPSSARADDKPLFYVFNAAADGFVIVSGETAVEPILAYSNENSFDAEKINPALRYYLDGYEKQIEEIRENKLSANRETAQKWDDLLSGKNIRATGGKGPLVAAKWNQSPYYNLYCPPETPVGCVAVAMGQIMNYWKYPLRGSGSNSYKSDFGTLFADFANTIYEWSIIPDSLRAGINADSTNPPAQHRELAKLLFHLGVSVEMQYSPDGSGAYTFFQTGYRYDVNYSAQTALNTFFGYDNTMKGVKRKGRSDNEWLSLVIKEIDEGRPVIYDGVDPKDKTNAHAFICDGYDNYDKLHFNWGWGGLGDGYFSATDLSGATQGSQFNYNNDHGMLIGIAPPQKLQPFDIRLDKVEAAEENIPFGETIRLSANISNRGSNLFRGKFCVVFYDDNGESADFSLFGDTLISANADAVFDFTGNISGQLKTGEYFAEIYYAVSGGNWLKFGDLPTNEQIRISIKGDDATPIRENIGDAGKYAITLVKNVVSDFAEIVIRIPEPSTTKIVIYDQTGNTVFGKEFLISRSEFSFIWYLSNSNGRKVSAGAYLLVAEVKSISGKMYTYSAKIGVKK